MAILLCFPDSRKYKYDMGLLSSKNNATLVPGTTVHYQQQGTTRAGTSRVTRRTRTSYDHQRLLQSGTLFWMYLSSGRIGTGTPQM